MIFSLNSWYIIRENGLDSVVQIIEERIFDVGGRKNNYSSSITGGSRSRAKVIPSKEYYVHYQGMDKRMDKWVHEKQFITETFPNLDVGHESSLSPSQMNEDDRLEREHEEATKVKNVQQIQIGRFGIDCWYFSPFPQEFIEGFDKLFVCERCLLYLRSEDEYSQHWYNDCEWKNGPPGTLIYLKDQLAVFELDGEKQKLFCQNLCLLAKLFLDHKTLYYDVGPFKFYLLCEVDDLGCHPVGYFSKEKESADEYNLACIMILPPFQKRGYGRFLIQLSYELTKREGKTGSPERPLSDLGKLSYRSYWNHEILKMLRSASRGRRVPSITGLAHDTGIRKEDIESSLREMGLLTKYRGQEVLSMAPKNIEDQLRPFEKKKICPLDEESLSWP